MPERTQYEPGRPCWVDLMTTDPAAAQKFYGDLFDWTFEDQGAEAGNYVIAKKNGETVAGLMQQQPEQAAMGIPSVWSNYVSVSDADATVAKAQDAGATVFVPVMDVMDLGRMAVFADPTGAVIGIWQPKNFPGAELVNEHGTWTWSELITPGTDEAAKFYASVLGWTAEAFPGPMEYTVLNNNGEGIGGMMKPPMDGIPPNWAIYFAVDDTDAIVDAATKAGASPMMPATDIPTVGRIAGMLDPTGAAFFVIKPAPQPS